MKDSGKNRLNRNAKLTKKMLSFDYIRKMEKRNSSKSLFSRTIKWANTYKFHMLKGSLALGLITGITLSGNAYVKNHTYDIYHVFVGSQEIGSVDSKEKVEQYIADKYEKIKKENPDVHMEMQSDPITYQHERAFNAKSDNRSVLAALDPLLKPQALGAKLLVDGKVVAIVKDEQTAQSILDQLKSRYTPKKGAKEVAVLSASKGGATAAKSELQSVTFTKDVEIQSSEINSSDILEPDQVLKKLETGGVEPTKYTVKDGDCISCIAAKFHIDKQVIYDRNPWIVDDMIRPGDILDITVYQPTLGVKTVETYTEQEEIQYQTQYKLDASIRSGKVKIISPGKNGLKNVTFEVTRINGQMTKEELVNEQVIRQPVTAQAVKGTKIILGQGTGSFAWPVSRARITSGFGARWGAFHKGVDLISANRSILAADNGKVIFAGWDSGGYGNLVILDHLNGYQTYYGHLSSVSVSKGDTVEKGEKIGVMGQTGDATGVHLHFEVRVNGDPENPLKFLN